MSDIPPQQEIAIAPPIAPSTPLHEDMTLCYNNNPSLSNTARGEDLCSPTYTPNITQADMEKLLQELTKDDPEEDNRYLGIDTLFDQINLDLGVPHCPPNSPAQQSTDPQPPPMITAKERPDQPVQGEQTRPNKRPATPHPSAGLLEACTSDYKPPPSKRQCKTRPILPRAQPHPQPTLGHQIAAYAASNLNKIFVERCLDAAAPFNEIISTSCEKIKLSEIISAGWGGFQIFRDGRTKTVKFAADQPQEPSAAEILAKLGLEAQGGNGSCKKATPLTYISDTENGERHFIDCPAVGHNPNPRAVTVRQRIRPLEPTMVDATRDQTGSILRVVTQSESLTSAAHLGKRPSNGHARGHFIFPDGQFAMALEEMIGSTLPMDLLTQPFTMGCVKALFNKARLTFNGQTVRDAVYPSSADSILMTGATRGVYLDEPHQICDAAGLATPSTNFKF